MSEPITLRDTIQLAEPEIMRAELAKITSADTSTLVEIFAGQQLTVMELYQTAETFCDAQGLTTVKFLRIFNRSATIAVMEKMVVASQRDLMRDLFIMMAKRLVRG